MWFITVCQSLKEIEDNCVAISEELRAHSFDSWTGQGSEGARAEIEQIRNDCRMWAALAIEARDLAEIESVALGGQT
ncbi:hypothetical protein [uncultured Actinomyces sp.]|uniref:hypothetical protein n=1 Tax=uncultured Actinomyces sp. TaxID=249061 RepID=UPI002616B710|nr:hypothetical protein [uncultured Actinomyces sp.]